MKRRGAVAILLALIMVLTYIPAMSFAASESETIDAAGVTIKLYLNGGTISGERKVKVIELDELTEDYELPVPVKSGYDFEGWMDEDDEIVEPTIKAGTTGKVDRYAEWTSQSGAVCDVTAVIDVPIAINGKPYSADPFTFANDGNTHEVVYHCREIEGPWESDYDSTPYEEVTSKDGLIFGSDGSISGTANADNKWLELIAGIITKDGSSITGYREYKFWIHFNSAATHYTIPSDVIEMDLTTAGDSGWYDFVSESDDYNMPFYRYIVPGGQEKWVKVRAASHQMMIVTDWNIPVKVIGADGYAREAVNDDFGLANHIVTPGEYYYLYVDNTNGTEDKTVCVNEGVYHRYGTGNLGSWSFEKTGVDDGWKVYRVGELDGWYNWNVKGYSLYGNVNYWCSLAVISPVPVRFAEPLIEANFGSNYSIYKSDRMSDTEEEQLMGEDEKLYKVNYFFQMADNSYSTERRSRTTINVYVPEGYSLFRGEDDFLHVREGDEPVPPCEHSMTHHEAREATCTTDGNVEYWECALCGRKFSDEAGAEEIIDDVTVHSLGHSWNAPGYEWSGDYSTVTATRTCKNDTGSTHTVSETVKTTSEVTKAATYTAMGQRTYTAVFTNKSFETQTKTVTNVPKLTPASITKATVTGLSAKVYTGSVIKPAPVVKLNGKTLKSGTDYTVSYKNNKNVGKATVTITGKTAYKGTITKTFKINPKATTLGTLTPASKAITVNWKKLTTQTTGYEIQLATNSSFTSNKKTVIVSKNTTTSRKITGLKASKKYYVRIRTYKKVGDVKYYSAWSKYKTATTKK